MTQLALSLVLTVLFVRALWFWPEGWLRRKPLVCDACCVGWLTIPVLWFHSYLGLTAFEAMGGAGLALLLLALHGYLKSTLGPPPSA